MHRLKQILQEDIQKKRAYFQEAAQEIAERNLKMLKLLCPLTILLLILFISVTPLIIRGWHPTPQHLLFLPAMFLLFLLTTFYEKQQPVHNSFQVSALCYLYEAVLFIFIILIDALQSPVAPASFMPVLFIVLPTLFILPFHRNYSLIFFFEVIYVILIFLYKSPDVGQYDIFDSVVGLAFSFSVAQPTMRLRIQDHETRMNYRQLSQQDSLSGLLNKTTSQEHLERYLQLTAPSTVCTMLILDLDDFKAVNDTMGHYTGDLLLRTMGEVLVSSFRTTDMIGRFGGDEFIVLMKETADYTLLEEKCQSIHQQLQEVTADICCSAPATCSIGGILVYHQQADFYSLFQQADQALYQAKEAGKNKHVLRFYQPSK